MVLWRDTLKGEDKMPNGEGTTELDIKRFEDWLFKNYSWTQVSQFKMTYHRKDWLRTELGQYWRKYIKKPLAELPPKPKLPPKSEPTKAKKQTAKEEWIKRLKLPDPAAFSKEDYLVALQNRIEELWAEGTIFDRDVAELLQYGQDAWENFLSIPNRLDYDTDREYLNALKMRLGELGKVRSNSNSDIAENWEVSLNEIKTDKAD